MKVINKLDAKLFIDNKVINSTFLPLAGRGNQEVLGGFSFGKDYWYLTERFFGLEIINDDQILLHYKYLNDNQVYDFLIEEDSPLLIEDKISKWDNENQKLEFIDFKIEITLKFLETRIDNIVLKVTERADDSWGETYIPGIKESSYIVKEGDEINASLLKKDKLKIIIKKIDGINVYLDVFDNSSMNKEFILNQFYFLYLKSNGGFNTRYDYESWSWDIKIEIEIKDSIKFKGKW